MTYKILHIKLARECNAPPEINVWNIFDCEHPPFMHGKRKLGEGMEPSYILYEDNKMNITLDTQKLPFFSFIKYTSIMAHVSYPDNSVVQYSSFFGVPTLQRYSVENDLKNNKFHYKIEIFFYLTGLWKPLSGLINKYVKYWLSNTWDEDLVMKERRHKFLNLGFRDMSGLPENIKDRNCNNIQKLRLPLPRIGSQVDQHPFSFLNQKKLFKNDEDTS
jgi:hypothetical protein